ncbi:hypothetical protein [Streptomyces sp. NPDC000410]|uniref:hypothetical protein n=1 Tax=Streptomyces sp. NPDC000410 TaxID=3154254 RepID=UPI003316C5AB
MVLITRPPGSEELSQVNKHVWSLGGAAGAAVLGVVAALGPAAGTAAAGEDKIALISKVGVEDEVVVALAADGSSVVTRKVVDRPDTEQRWSTDEDAVPTVRHSNGKCLTVSEDGGSVSLETCYSLDAWLDDDPAAEKLADRQAFRIGDKGDIERRVESLGDASYGTCLKAAGVGERVELADCDLADKGQVWLHFPGL